MIEYQNIFTQVQVRGPAEMGLDNEAGTMAAERMGTPWFSNLAGWIGNAQLGPVYLGWTGMIGLATGLAWFFIVGISMLAQVDWSLPEFLRQGFWLALEPPGPEHGLSMPPLNDGGFISSPPSSCWFRFARGGCVPIFWRKSKRWANMWLGPSPVRFGCSWCLACSGPS